MKRSIVAVAALAACAVGAPALAQSQNDENQVLISQIQTDKRAVVLRGLQLTDAQSNAFVPIYDEYQAERKKLADRSVDLLDKFAANYDSMTDDAAKGILKDWFDIEDERISLIKKYAKRFEKVLPATRVLRFVQIENKLDTLIEMQAVRAIPLAQP
jgi:hypothetical protein